MSQLVSSVEKRFAHSKDPLGGDAHDQECFEAEKDILHWIEKVWKDDDKKLAIDMFRVIQK